MFQSWYVKVPYWYGLGMWGKPLMKENNIMCSITFAQKSIFSKVSSHVFPLSVPCPLMQMFRKIHKNRNSLKNVNYNTIEKDDIMESVGR
jgi:hypothetical protein